MVIRKTVLCPPATVRRSSTAVRERHVPSLAMCRASVIRCHSVDVHSWRGRAESSRRSDSWRWAESEHTISSGPPIITKSVAPLKWGPRKCRVSRRVQVPTPSICSVSKRSFEPPLIKATADDDWLAKSRDALSQPSDSSADSGLSAQSFVRRHSKRTVVLTVEPTFDFVN